MAEHVIQSGAQDALITPVQKSDQHIFGRFSAKNLHHRDIESSCETPHHWLRRTFRIVYRTLLRACFRRAERAARGCACKVETNNVLTSLVINSAVLRENSDRFGPHKEWNIVDSRQFAKLPAKRRYEALDRYVDEAVFRIGLNRSYGTPRHCQ